VVGGTPRASYMRPIFSPAVGLLIALSACSPHSETQSSFDTDLAECRYDADRRPELVEGDVNHYCRPGYRYDVSYDLCVDEDSALGPFSADMVELCQRCGGDDCEQRIWPANQARRMRGTEACPRGSEKNDLDLCVDELHAYGPFSEEMVERCIENDGGEYTCRTMQWDRRFAEALAEGLEPGGSMGPTMVSGQWQYPLPLDHGLRADGFGGGHFGATRSGNSGGHSGIDILAPIGTPLSAVCDGKVRYAGWVSGYGNFVQILCPIPTEVTGGQTLYASVAYAHLDEISVATDEQVDRGIEVGTVGKSGNASASGLNSHVHFEIAVHATLHSASVEGHASSNHASNPGGDKLVEDIISSCLEPNGFEPTTGPINKGRRIDPFLLLSCITGKPALTDPPSSLQSSIVPWSDHYQAVTFDVDVGL